MAACTSSGALVTGPSLKELERELSDAERLVEEDPELEKLAFSVFSAQPNLKRGR